MAIQSRWAVECIHAVLTDNNTHFTTPGNVAPVAAAYKDAMDRGEPFGAHAFELV